jgi:carboxylate-amine ligase
MLVEPSYEEDRDGRGSPRPGYAALLRALHGTDLDELVRAVGGHLAGHGVTFGGQPFVVDPIPRLIPAAEWEALAVGLGQRARALNAFLADAYGEQRIVAAGVLDAATITDAEGYEPQLSGRIPAGAAAAAIIGFDLVRVPDGRFLVLEDNLRTPSGIAYLVAAREAVRAALPRGVPVPQPVAPAILKLLDDTLHAAVPDGGPERPTIVLLTDGPDSAAFYEHRTLARALRIPLVRTADLRRTGDRLRARLHDGRETVVDVVYLRRGGTGPSRRTGRRRRSASCCASRGWRGRSGWSTTSATASPTTS